MNLPVSAKHTTSKDLARLEAANERLRFFLQHAKASNTQRAYLSDWNQFESWCNECGLMAMPALPSTVALYLSEHAGTLKPSTLKRRLSSISKLHQIAGYDSPTHDALVKTAWDGIKRTHGSLQTGKSPLLTDDVRSMVDALPESLSTIRDRALLLIGFAGCFRRSELVALDVMDLTFVREGVIVQIRKSKTDQEGHGIKKGIPYGATDACPVRALQTWIEVAGLSEGPLFRPVDRHDNIRDRRLTSQSVALIVKKACRAAGLDPKTYAGHSLRSGLATQAAISGVDEASIVRQGGWMTEKMARRYVRDGSLFRNNAAGKVGL